MIRLPGLLMAIWLAAQCSAALGQAQVRILQNSAYAGVDMHGAEFDRGAFNDFRSLARLGDTTAQFNLGVLHHVRGEYTHASVWYRRAALFRHPLAAYNLALMYYRGEGVERDLSQAFRWMLKSAEAGFITAQLRVGIMIYRGEGTERDSEREAYWYRQAALKGDPEAQFNLSILYSMGEGVPHDPVNAYAWMKMAAVRGLSAGSELLMLESLLTPQQLLAAEARFSELDGEIPDLSRTDSNS